jgi:pimeloyl-ACP methyl ester carboxylesterase
MKTIWFVILLVVIATGALTQNAPGQEKNPPNAKGAVPFAGEKTSWHGFDRYDFLLDEANLTIKPIKAAPDEKNGIKGQVKGQLRCVVVVPRDPATGVPWSWRGYYFDHEPQAEIELLKRGFHIGYIQVDAGKQWDAWYKFLTEQHGWSKKPAFVGMSRGGRNAFTWATANPDKVSCIYADNPAISRESLMKLGELAQNDVPLLHVCGSLDPILGNHTLPIESIYQQLGGRISVMIKDGAGHHPHSLRDPTPIADFIVRSLEPASGASLAFAGTKFTRTSFYGVENSHRDFPKEGMYITCRGPWFLESYDRYEFKLDGIKGAVTVIAPRTAAAGKPWVLRADFVTRDAVVDLALLGKGFHIVTGPVPTDTNGPVLQQWNAVYKYLVDHGFSKKPVMEGAGGAAGDGYAWAIANPDKVSCIYGENPVLRSNMSKAQPLENLAGLAKAGVPLLHVCGSLDPSFKSQTQVAEKRYKDLGGNITVIVKEGEGHYPLVPKDRQPVVDFIVKNASGKTEESSASKK